MKVEVTKLTDYGLMREAAATTVRNDCANMNPVVAYYSEHSPIRTQIFKVVMDDIPVAYSTHFLRHNIGFDFQGVLTHRPDRGGEGELVVHRLTSTKHMMICNAQAMINMARWRICYKAHEKAREIMRMIHEGVCSVDAALGRVMRPNCLYHGMVCFEAKMCWRVENVVHWRTVEEELVWKWPANVVASDKER